MRLSREKLIHLSHVIVDGLEETPGIDLHRDRNDVRLSILDVLHDAMRLEDEMDMAARRKIESQKKEIPEGSRDWEILYRKYYAEEVDKHRKVR